MQEWQLRATLWWCKALYGVLSLPFVIFLLPGAPIGGRRPCPYERCACPEKEGDAIIFLLPGIGGVKGADFGCFQPPGSWRFRP